MEILYAIIAIGIIGTVAYFTIRKRVKNDINDNIEKR